MHPMLRQGMHEVPQYSSGERLADAFIHIVGCLAAVFGCAVLASLAARSGRAEVVFALIPYAVGLIAMLGCSALYHLTRPGRRKAFLRRLDHAAIFLMIAGTYTPVTLLAIGDSWGRWLLTAVWVGAAVGAVLKLLAPQRFERASIAVYLLLGWVVLLALDPLLAALPTSDLSLLIVGGLLYSGGVVIHLSPHLPYHNALWHALVLAAATCHYAVVLHLAQADG